MPTTLHPALRFQNKKANTIWRYMDLAKFHSLVKSQQLWLSQRSKLGDPFEGAVPGDDIVRLRASENDAIYGRTVESRLQEWLRRDSERVRLTTLRQQRREWQYANCWNRSSSESMALWQLYGHAGNTVAIRSSLPRLQKSLAAEFPPLSIVPAKYLEWNDKRWNTLSEESQSQLKHRSYEHEREIRVLWEKPQVGEDAWTYNPPGYLVDIHVETLIEQVLVAPQTSDFFREAAQDILDCHLSEGHSIRVAPSIMHSGSN